MLMFNSKMAAGSELKSRTVLRFNSGGQKSKLKSRVEELCSG